MEVSGILSPIVLNTACNDPWKHIKNLNFIVGNKQFNILLIDRFFPFSLLAPSCKMLNGVEPISTFISS